MRLPRREGPAKARAGGRRWRSGTLLMEVSVALGLAVVVALLLMKASLLAVTGNEWTTMQSLTDALMTREAALANRMPFADLTSETSLWPDAAAGLPEAGTTVVLGRLMGGAQVSGQLTRFRVNEADTSEPEVSLAVWRLHSVLRYRVGDHEYVKSSATLRVQ